MNILIAGGSGYLGRALIERWSQHNVTVVGRDVSKIKKQFDKKVTALGWDELNKESLSHIDVIIDLTGKSIGARWTTKVKNEIINSRVDSTKKLVDLCTQLDNKPSLFVASGISAYGLQESQGHGLPVACIEETPVDLTHYPDFMSEVARRREAELKPAIENGNRVVALRLAVVLGPKGGVLKQLKIPYLFGLGGPIGSGQQPFCWVSLADVVGAIDFLIEHPEIDGPVNIAAPNTVTQKDFAKTMGKVLHRPTFLPTPEILMRVMMGQMAEELILRGTHVAPKRLLADGFSFQHPALEEALNVALKR